MRLARLRLVITAIAALALVLPVASITDAQSKGTIKIASQSPLSGGQAVLGEGIKLGAQLAIEKQKGSLSQDVARGVSGEHDVGIHLRNDLVRVVMKDESEEIGQSSAVGRLRAKKGCGTFAPGELLRGWLRRPPSLFVEDCSHVHRGEGIYGGDGLGACLFGKH